MKGFFKSLHRFGEMRRFEGRRLRMPGQVPGAFEFILFISRLAAKQHLQLRQGSGVIRR